MKFILLMGALATWSAEVLGAGSQLTPGIYGFSGEIHSVQMRIVEKVFAGSAEGRDRIALLEKEGFYCTAAIWGFLKCQKHKNVSDLSSSLKSKLDQEVGKVKLQVEPLETSPELIYQADGFEEWKVTQAVTVGSRAFPGYRIIVRASGEQSLFFGNPAEVTFAWSAPGSLSYPVSLVEQESPNRFVNYFVLAKMQHRP